MQGKNSIHHTQQCSHNEEMTENHEVDEILEEPISGEIVPLDTVTETAAELAMLQAMAQEVLNEGAAAEGAFVDADVAGLESEETAIEKIILPPAGDPALVLNFSIPSDQHPAAVYLASLAKRSQRTIRGDLDVIAHYLSGGRSDAMTLHWGLVRYQHAAAVRAALAERYVYTSVRRMLSALRGVLKAAWRLGQLPTEEYHRAIDLPPVKGETLPRGRALPMGELRALFATCAADGKANGARDAALLAVLYGAGLRRSEAVALDLSDYDGESGSLTVRSGKGNKQRMAYVTHGGKAALDAWLRVRGDLEGPLFLPLTKSGKLIWRRLNNQAVLDILRKRVQQTGTKPCSPHDFRRSFISDLLDAGADISTVQKLAGHANVTTTARYDRRGEVTKQKAAELLHVPFSE